MASQSSAFSVGNLAQIFTRVYILMIFGHHSRQIDHFLTVQYPPLSIQDQSVINEDYSDGDGVYNGEENTNIERSRHHSRYSSTL